MKAKTIRKTYNDIKREEYLKEYKELQKKQMLLIIKQDKKQATPEDNRSYCDNARRLYELNAILYR